MRLIFLFCLVIITFFPITVIAEEGEPSDGSVFDMYHPPEGSGGEIVEEIEESIVNEEALLENETSFFVIFVQMIGALVVIIALIYIFLKFVNAKSRSFRNHHTIQNLGGVPLGANRSVQMVKIGERILVVGVGETIQLLKEIDSQDEVDMLLNDQNRDNSMSNIEDPVTKASKWISQKVKGSSKSNSKNELEFGELLDKQFNDVSQSQQKIHQAIKEHKK
ncbi:flagellar biosynthetic protein FliO [Bacillus sp. FJAT-45350]|uniref:flagellar biosynthetic protein FliO n=1 Tax=Bacillus sp. FJAT-45350 TaxID=2011014 RepID=UPI000BB8E47A|nr:flagellar biosynthetic protein FliO [Bacillus sp. FJAT-45350]